MRYLSLLLLAASLPAAPVLSTMAEANGHIENSEGARISRACGPDNGTTGVDCEVSGEVPADAVDGSFYAYSLARASAFSLLADTFVNVVSLLYASEPPQGVNWVVFNEARARSWAQMEDQLTFGGTGQGTIRYAIDAWWTTHSATAEFWHNGVAAPLVPGETIEFVQPFTFGVPFTIRASVQAETYVDLFGTWGEWAMLDFRILEVTEPQQMETPEPAAWLLTGGGLAALLYRYRAHRRRAGHDTIA